MTRRPSARTTAVLESLLQSEAEWSYGYELSKRLGIPSGTLYPILMRLEERGQLETRWSEPSSKGRPPRHMYRLTEGGREWALVAAAPRANARSAMPHPVSETG